jgi:hypothetical protein
MQGMGAVELSDPMAAIGAAFFLLVLLASLAGVARALRREGSDPLEGLFTPGRLAAEIAACERRHAQAGRAPMRSDGLAGRLRRTIDRADPVRTTTTKRNAGPAAAAAAAAAEWEEVLLLPPPEQTARAA